MLAATLPEHIPEVVQYHDLPTNTLPFAVYTLYECDGGQLNQLYDACLFSMPTQDRAGVLLPPERHSFNNDSLQPIVEHHIRLGAAGSHDPLYFIVATSNSWSSEGVLLVTLDSGEGHGKPDVFRVRAKHVGLLLVNLQNGNLEWEEQKECYDFDIDANEAARAAFEDEECGTPGSHEDDGYVLAEDKH